MLNPDARPTLALLLCAFRPFFLFAALAATLAMIAWALFLGGHIALPTTPAGPIAWHGHEMVFGFGLAAVAGFALTAVPEFTATRAVNTRVVATLCVLWLLARAGFAIGGEPGAWLAAFAESLLMVGLIATLAPRVWHDADRRHLSFLWALLGLFVTVVGYHADTLAGQGGARWLHAATGLLMVLMVAAMSRISMRIVNAALEERGDNDTPYLARPPRRNLATFCIVLYTALEFVQPGASISGWVALAAAAAMLNLLNDWHVGRALFSRWVIMLYAVYWLMAIGYALIGLAVLADVGTISGGRHVLTIGAMGLGIFVVMNIAGRVHAGVKPDHRAWVQLVALALVAAALARATYPGFGPSISLFLPAILWTLCFILYFAHAWPVMSRPRPDGQAGCAGLSEAPAPGLR